MAGISDVYDRRDALGLAELVRQREVTAAELLEEAIARADRVDPRLNALVHRMHDVARERAKGPLDGPFAGVPFVLKDLLSGYAGQPITHGSRLYQGHVATEHAELVRRYERAGVVTFAKANTSEFGILPVTEPELHGRTENPWRLGITAGGSSGGPAAAVAAGIVPIAHGGDGGGSIRIPASCCGLYGLKPSRGRNPVGPDESEFFFGFAIEHVLTRSVRDSAAMLDCTAGPEPSALWYAPPGDSFARALAQRPERLRIAFTSEPLLPAPAHPELTRAVEDAASLCAELGHDVERARPSFDGRAFARAFFLHFACGVASELLLAGRLRGRPVREHEVERATWLLGLVGRSVDGGSFVLARRILLEQARAVLKFFERFDVLLTPTLGMPPVAHGALAATGFEAHVQALVARAARPEIMKLPGVVDRAVERAYEFAPYAAVFNVTGQPSASVPLWWSADGLPIGTMFTGRMGEDARVLRLSAQLEEARPWFDRRPPIRA